SGVGINNRYVAWGCGFIDYDNDGWADLMQINGHVYPEIEGHDIGQTYKNPRLVYRNLGNGQFKDVSSEMGPGITEHFSSRRAAGGCISDWGRRKLSIALKCSGGPRRRSSDSLRSKPTRFLRFEKAAGLLSPELCSSNQQNKHLSFRGVEQRETTRNLLVAS